MTTPLFFLHIPKNSGTTLNQIVRQNYHAIFKVSWDAASPRHAMSLLAAGDTGVFGDAEVVSGRYPWGLHRVLGEATDARYMTMLREPLARSLSGYNYLRSDSKYVRENPSLKRKLEGMSIVDFFSDFHPDIPNHLYVDNCQVRYLSGIGETRPFGSLTDDDLETAKRHLSSMVFGITERFDLSILHLRAALEWSSVLYLRARVGSTPKQVLTEAEQPVLQARNALDLELYRYGLELFAHHTATIDAAAIDAYRKALERHARIQSVLRLPRAAAGRLRRALGRV